MSWTISVPHRHADEAIADVLHHCGRLLPDEEAAVMRRLVTDLALDGADTAGDVLSRIESATPEQRRAMLDRARRGCGLPTAAEADEHERVAVLVRPGRGPTLQRCAISTCATVPTNGLGVPTTVDARRWHCPAHRHLAAVDDMQPHGSGLRYSESGAIVPVDPAGDAAEREREASRRAQLRAQGEIRAVEAAEIAASTRARDEAAEREMPEHLRGLTG